MQCVDCLSLSVSPSPSFISVLSPVPQYPCSYHILVHFLVVYCCPSIPAVSTLTAIDSPISISDPSTSTRPTCRPVSKLARTLLCCSPRNSTLLVSYECSTGSGPYKLRKRNCLDKTQTEKQRSNCEEYGHLHVYRETCFLLCVCL